MLVHTQIEWRRISKDSPIFFQESECIHAALNRFLTLDYMFFFFFFSTQTFIFILHQTDYIVFLACPSIIFILHLGLLPKHFYLRPTRPFFFLVKKHFCFLNGGKKRRKKLKIIFRPLLSNPANHWNQGPSFLYHTYYSYG